VLREPLITKVGLTLTAIVVACSISTNFYPQTLLGWVVDRHLAAIEMRRGIAEIGKGRVGFVTMADGQSTPKPHPPFVFA